ncbi:hypothetical protein [uncultured Sphingomonas sp.]|uniref:hypothetical protein n=1 Tax=uncultured Sphingomonas sp. TaxID=158754 RepID=UPI0035CC81DD
MPRRSFLTGTACATAAPGPDDVATLWPPGRKPVPVASYIADSPLDLARSDVVHARLGAPIAEAVG